LALNDFPRLIASQRYFFYATLTSQSTDDYNLEDEEGERELSHTTLDDDTVMVPVDEEKVVTPEVERDEIDAALAEWLKVDEKKPAAPTYVNDDSETEADSDNADVTEDAVDDDWFQVKRPDDVASETSKLPEKV
jgi:hypothetical protein